MIIFHVLLVHAIALVRGCDNKSYIEERENISIVFPSEDARASGGSRATWGRYSLGEMEILCSLEKV